jgi:hypothetical protein
MLVTDMLCRKILLANRLRLEINYRLKIILVCYSHRFDLGSRRTVLSNQRKIRRTRTLILAKPFKMTNRQPLTANR